MTAEDRRRDDRDRVVTLLGRPPRGDFDVVVRSTDGDPVVIRNAPLLLDGTPMPTRYWLVSPSLRLLVDRLESGGGVRRAEAETDSGEVATAHTRYATERDRDIPPGWSGPRPSGGVGGTRRGVKCLHAHLAWHLAGGDDPVGRWTVTALALDGAAVEGEGIVEVHADPTGHPHLPPHGTVSDRPSTGRAGRWEAAP